MNPILQVDKDEWEAFLSEFSKLTKNYELILSRLELAHTQMMAVNRRNESLTRELQTLVQSPHHDAAVSGKNQLEEPRRREPENQSIDVEPTIKSKPGLLGFLRAELSQISRRQTPIRTYASCRRCGFRIKRASRFCEGCKTDFGVPICPCGRGLSVDDKFCDRCGRVTGLR